MKPGRVAFHGILAVVFSSLAIVGSSHAQTGPDDRQPFGAFSHEIQGLHAATGAAVAYDGTVFVADTDADTLRAFDQNGVELENWPADDNDLELCAPHDLAIAPGMMFIADTGNCRIVQATLDGAVVGAWGSFGSSPTELNQPMGIAATADLVYVADTGNDRVMIFDHRGQPRQAIGSRGSGPGAFRRPTDIAVDSAGNFFVADSDNHRIQKFAADGTHLLSFGAWGAFPGLFSTPRTVAFHDGVIYVADVLSHRIQAFDANGEFLYQWGMHAVVPREGEGKIHYPVQLAIAPDGESVVICEPFEDRCQVFTRLGPDGEGGLDPPPLQRGNQSHFGARLGRDGLLMTLWELETCSLIVLNTSPHERPIKISQFGDHGKRFGQIGRIEAIGIDVDRKRLFIGDVANDRISEFILDVDLDAPIKFDPFMSRFAKAYDLSMLAADSGSGGSVIEPTAMKIGPDGYRYIVDARNARVWVFDHDMELVRSWGGFGAGAGQLRNPTDIAFSQDGRSAFVVDAWNKRVQVFDLEGNALGAFGNDVIAEHRLTMPFGIAAGRDGFVYVTDVGNDDVVKFDEQGGFVTRWSETGADYRTKKDMGPMFKPRGIAQDEHGWLTVVDHGNHRMHIYTDEGEWLVTFGAGRSYSPRVKPLAP